MISNLHIMPPPTGANTLPTVSTGSPASTGESLAQEFATAFSSALENLGINPSGLKISGGATAAPGQFSVTFTLPGNVSPMNTVPSTVTPPTAATPAATTATPAAAVAAPVTSPLPATSTTTHWYAPNAADDAYWSAQPPAVQQLRELTSESQRQALAATLTSQGYKIDVPIMVWGWDAAKVTSLRQGYGYTWVPAMGQAPIQVAPGLTEPGLTAYNPNNPPPGSIAVPPSAAGSAFV